MKRKLLMFALMISILGFGSIGWIEYLKTFVPSEIQVREGNTEEFNFSLPASAALKNSGQRWSLKQPFSMTASTTGRYELQVDLFGFIPLKTVQVEAVEEAYAIPCGCSVGIYMETDGVLVIDSASVHDRNGNEVRPAENILQSGDYILAVNNAKIMDKDMLVDAIDGSQGEALVLTVRRKKNVIQVMLTPIQVEDGSYKAGIWVRDDMQGIGTLTYMREDTFGALGHGVNDMDTGQLVEAAGGELRRANVLGITKGDKGAPGSLMGSVDYSEAGRIGTIEYNTECGIAGYLLNEDAVPDDIDRTAIPIGFRQDAHVGNATIQSDVSGEMESYEIAITDVHMGSTNSTKGLELTVTDPRLLTLTGGIIQGMSGSPIIQDGKLIGAVTHVFVNDPTRGYGIFIEEEMKACE